MLSELQINHTTTHRMSVSQQAIDHEWEEIQAAQRDPARFRPLYERYYEPIFRYIYRRTAEESLSADICSQVFLKAMQKIGGYAYRGVPFSAWLYRIASNEVTQHYRNAQKQRVVSIQDGRLEEMAEEMDEFDYQVHRSALLGALDKLPQKDIEIIELRFFEQRSFKEVANILNITENNAKVRTYRVLDKLKKLIKQ